MRRLLVLLAFTLPAFAQTYVFHTPIPMDQVQGVFAMQGSGAIDASLNPTMRAGGFLDLWQYRGRVTMSAITTAGSNPAAGVCYTGAADYLGWTFKSETTYRIRYGAGGGLQLCYLRDSLGHDNTRLWPLLEGLASLQFRVVPNIVGDITLSAGWPEGVSAAVAFGFAF